MVDIANIHLKVLNKIHLQKKSIILNCGYAQGISVKDVIQKFKENTKKKILIKVYKKRKGDMSKIISNNFKLKKFLNWKPRANNLNLMVRTSIKWEKNL